MDWGIDTSALMRMITYEPPSLANKVSEKVASIIEGGGTIHVSCLVVSEAYHALQHHYHATKENAIFYLLALSRQPGFHFDSEAIASLSRPNAATMSPGMVDCMIAGEYRSRGFRVLACEKDFRRLEDAEVVSE